MRRIPACVCALLLLFVSLGAAPAAAVVRAPQQPPGPPAPPAPPPTPKSWILIDDDTGNVLDAGNQHIPMLTASVIKVFTAFIAIQLLPADTDVPVSAKAQSMPANKMDIKAGQSWTLNDLLHALLIVSANDAAVAIAERASGSLDAFAQEMTYTAGRLHMQDNPVLQDPAGLDDEFSQAGGNRVSPFDLAVATRAALQVPQIREIVALNDYRFHGGDDHDHRIWNHNRLLKTYPGAIGVKTGYTRKAGHSLIAAATRDGRTMVAIVMGASDPYRSVSALLDKGFSVPAAAERGLEHLPPIVGNAAVHETPKPVNSLTPVTRPSKSVHHRVTGTASLNWTKELDSHLGLIGLGAVPVFLLAVGVTAMGFRGRRPAPKHRKSRDVPRHRRTPDRARQRPLVAAQPRGSAAQPRPPASRPRAAGAGGTRPQQPHGAEGAPARWRPDDDMWDSVPRVLANDD